MEMEDDDLDDGSNDEDGRRSYARRRILIEQMMEAMMMADEGRNAETRGGMAWRTRHHAGELSEEDRRIFQTVETCDVVGSVCYCFFRAEKTFELFSYPPLFLPRGDIDQ